MSSDELRCADAGENPRPAVFFDRDGIVNASPGPGRYVESWEGFRLLPGFVEALRVARRAGREAVIVTNQRGVALGVMSESVVRDIHARMRARLRDEYGLSVLDVLYCPHERGVCECRKPKPGMLIEAARRHGLDLARSWMIGDSGTDIEAGRRAGCRTVLVGDERTAREAGADRRAQDVDALPALLEVLLMKDGAPVMPEPDRT